MQQTVWKIQTLAKLKTEAFLYFPGMDSSALQYTRFPQCSITKAHKLNAFLAQTFK